jgi:hypothetical protein
MVATPPPAEWPPLVLGASLILGVSVNRVTEAARDVMYEQNARDGRAETRQVRREQRAETRFDERHDP